MSDPRLTAAQAFEQRQLAGKHSGTIGARYAMDRMWASHEAYRADVERLTAEHAALKTSDSQRVILEMLLSAIDTVLLGNEVSDFEESFPPVRQVIDLKDERDHLRAENAALREERDALKDGIKAELNGGNSLPDFWTPERQLPYVAKALTAARAERDALSADLTRAWKMHGEALGERDALREEVKRLAKEQRMADIVPAP
jgi:FtsZ-binding cell division protein ZapB